MIKRSLFLLLLVLAISRLNAQIFDEVSLGAQYSQQAYYNLSTGAVTAVQNDEWDIAFSNIGQTDAGVFINESASLSGTAISLFIAPTNDWSKNITDTSPFVDSVKIYNAELNWTDGAFNTVKDPNDPFDYGWGSYSVQSHQVEGTKIYVIQKRAGDFIKMQITALKNGYYHFRYADLDGTDEVVDSVAKSTNGVNSIVHYSFESNDIVSIANDYDLVFQRYFSPLDAGGGVLLEYAVTGILLAPGTQAAVADGVDLSTVKESDYADKYSSLPTTLGHDWKAFDFTLGWIIDEDRANFVRTKNGEVYKLVFVDFEGSGTGTTAVERTLLKTAATEEIKVTNETISFYPNPVKEAITFKSEKSSNLEVSIFNSLGQNILKTNTYSNASILLPENITNGIYHMVVKNKNQTTTHSFIVLK